MNRGEIKSIKEQYQIFDELLKERINTLMPVLLKECGIDFYLVVCREYNEDPIFKTITPMLVKNASRTSCFAFAIDEKGNYGAYSLSRPNPRLSSFYKQAYDPKTQDQFKAIKELIVKLNVKNVGVNISDDCAQADGLSKYLFDKLTETIPGVTLNSAHDLSIRWLSTRTIKELEMYPKIYSIAMGVLEDAYTTNVITPGVTTTTDVEWYIMQKINELGLDAWFAPDVDLQRKGSSEQRMSGVVIQEGDLLHTDMGLTYLGGLHTDTQRLAYVLKRSEGETEIPEGILKGFAVGNRFQDIVIENMKTGLTGNDILASSLKQASEENVRATLYTHPIGLYGHGAGPSIGMWDNQEFVKGHGEEILYPNTCYALELNIVEKVSEWDNQDVCFMLEETVAYYRDSDVKFLDDKRKKIRVVG